MGLKMSVKFNGEMIGEPEQKRFKFFQVFSGVSSRVNRPV